MLATSSAFGNTGQLDRWNTMRLSPEQHALETLECLVFQKQCIADAEIDRQLKLQGLPAGNDVYLAAGVLHSTNTSGQFDQLIGAISNLAARF